MCFILNLLVPSSQWTDALMNYIHVLLFVCDIVFGFFKRFRGQEATSSYTLQLGYLSGPLITTGDALVYVTATAGSGSTNASE